MPTEEKNQRVLRALAECSFPERCNPTTEIGRLIKKTLLEDPKAREAVRRAASDLTQNLSTALSKR